MLPSASGNARSRGAGEGEEARTDRGKELAERTNVMVSNSGLLLLTTFFAASFVSNCQRGGGRWRRERRMGGRVNIASGLLFSYAAGRGGGWASWRAGAMPGCDGDERASVSHSKRGSSKKSEERNGEGNSWRPRDYGDLRTPALNYINCHQMRARSREAETSPGYTSA